MSDHDRSILLVEDSEDDVELALLALRDVGLTGGVDVARDGEEAIAYLFGGMGQPRSWPLFVLLDVKLPKVDGFEVLRRIRQDSLTRTLPVIMLSSSDVPEDVARAYALGANSYVCKPVAFSEYEDTIRQLGLYWVHVNVACNRRQ
jgi:two-component system response regulator